MASVGAATQLYVMRILDLSDMDSLTCLAQETPLRSMRLSAEGGLSLALGGQSGFRGLDQMGGEDRIA
jgi:hypothetical protein